MAIINNHPGKTQPKKTKPIDIHTENQTAVVDTDVMRLDNILTHVEGMSWLVTYYQQVLGEHDETASQEVSLDPVNQQYRKVESFEFKVQSELSVSTNTESYAQTLTGDSIIYPGTLIPNKGDVFLADIGSGEVGVFSLTEVDLLSHYKDRCYQVSYRMVRRVSGKTDRYLTDLDNKVVQSYVYQRDYLVYGKNPVITESEYTLNQRLQGQIEALMTYYFNVYFSDNHSTFLFPDNASVAYDPAIPKVFLSLFNSHDHPLMRRLRTINTEAIPETQQMGIWDVLLKRSPQLLTTIPRRAKLVPTRCYANNPQLYNIAYSGMQYVIIPEKMYSVNHDKDTPYLHEYIPKIEVRYKDLGKQMKSDVASGSTPDTPIVRRLDTYVVTSGVYDQSEVSTTIESMVRSYLDKTGMDLEVLMGLSERAMKWPYLEGYYYIPVLLILMLSGLRGA